MLSFNDSPFHLCTRRKHQTSVAHRTLNALTAARAFKWEFSWEGILLNSLEATRGTDTALRVIAKAGSTVPVREVEGSSPAVLVEAGGQVVVLVDLQEHAATREAAFGILCCGGFSPENQDSDSESDSDSRRNSRIEAAAKAGFEEDPQVLGGALAQGAHHVGVIQRLGLVLPSMVVFVPSRSSS